LFTLLIILLFDFGDASGNNSANRRRISGHVGGPIPGSPRINQPRRHSITSHMVKKVIDSTSLYFFAVIREVGKTSRAGRTDRPGRRLLQRESYGVPFLKMIGK
jgi:hypothetical protein